jgi:hypothetical protein
MNNSIIEAEDENGSSSKKFKKFQSNSLKNVLSKENKFWA